MSKKILLTIGILIIIGIALFLILGSRPQAPGENGVGFSIRNYLPFGQSNNPGTTSTTTANNNQNASTTNELTNTQVNQPVPRLRKISGEPIAGAIIFNIGTTSVVRFVEKGTGNVYEARSDSNAITRLTNTTIPKIIRSFWLPDGSGFLAQTLLIPNEVIETNFVKLNKNKASSTDESLTPFSTTIGKLPTDIKEITIKPDGSKIFYYTVNNSSNWFVSNPDGTKASLVMSHPLTEWLPKWIAGDTIIMQSKASSEAVGFVYSFNISSKVLKKVWTEASGLAVNPNAEDSFEIVSSGGSAPQLSLIDNKNITTNVISPNTLAEKCVWLKAKSPSAYCAVPNQIPKGNYPDVWYQGLVSTEDSITSVDLINDVSHTIANLSALSGQKIDVADMSLSPNETHLIFRNKIDGYLWLLRIAE
jgi:hypothetical protein